MSSAETVPDGDDLPEQFIPGIQSVESRPFDFVRRDPYADTIGLIPELFKRSREGARVLSDSYRGFQVGAAAVAYDFSPEHPRRAIYTAGNYKMKLRDEERDPEDIGDVSKVCAEMDILFRAEDEKFQWIGAMVIAGTTKPERIEAVTGVPSATLHPCEDCGTIFESHQLIDSYTDLFTTGSAPEFGKYQLQSYQRYAKRYERYRRSGNFKDATLRNYIASEWPYRRDLYLRQAKKDKVSGSVYVGGAKKQNARRALMIEKMTAPLGFEKSA